MNPCTTRAQYFIFKGTKSLFSDVIWGHNFSVLFHQNKWDIKNKNIELLCAGFINYSFSRAKDQTQGLAHIRQAITELDPNAELF